MNKFYHLSEKEVQIAIDMYKAGHTNNEIGEHLCVSPTAVYYHLHKRGIGVGRKATGAERRDPQTTEHGGKVLRIAYSDKKDLLWQLEKIKSSLMKEV